MFSPHSQLARQLLPVIDIGNDAAHDLSHIARVWRNAFVIQSEEGGDVEILAAAVLLHDCVHVPKNSPDRGRASQLAAQRAATHLSSLGWESGKVSAVHHAIEAHSFSAGVEPQTLEACILQDADRLDAIGSIGIARCFQTAGHLNSALYDLGDPLAKTRELDDGRFALDHFPAKLLGLASGFRTSTGQRAARQRHELLLRFYEEFIREVGA